VRSRLCAEKGRMREQVSLQRRRGEKRLPLPLTRGRKLAGHSGLGERGARQREHALPLPPPYLDCPPTYTHALTSHSQVDCVGDGASVAVPQGVGVHGLAGGGTDGGSHSPRSARTCVWGGAVGGLYGEQHPCWLWRNLSASVWQGQGQDSAQLATALQTDTLYACKAEGAAAQPHLSVGALTGCLSCGLSKRLAVARGSRDGSSNRLVVTAGVGLEQEGRRRQERCAGGPVGS
jgi:hypothetical protein